jgi:hypothetical protein
MVGVAVTSQSSSKQRFPIIKAGSFPDDGGDEWLYWLKR